MRCPVDKQDMIVVEYHDVEIDYCEDCKGIWLDAGEFDLLADALSGKSTAQSRKMEIIKTNEHGRKCPVCGKKMDKMFFNDDNKVIIDSCPMGDGMWFDGGELQQILKKYSIKTDLGKDNILTFLAEAFQADFKPNTAAKTGTNLPEN